MKKTLIAAVFMVIAGGASATDFSVLQALKVPVAKAAPVQAQAKNEKRLAISENIESVGIAVVKSQSGDYFVLRYILEIYDIYPQLRVEIFQKGGEGDPTVINATIDVYRGPAPGDAQIEDVKWAGYTLNFKLDGKNCVFDLGENFSRLGKNFETADSLKYACAK